MKKFLYTICFLFLSISSAYADTTQQLNESLGLNKVKITDTLPIFKFSGIVETILTLLFAVVVLFFILRVIITGIKISGAGGDVAKRQEGFKSLVNNIIGLLVSLFAVFITIFILSFLGVGLPNSVLPDCKTRDGIDKFNCQVEAIKLIDPKNAERDCNYIGGNYLGNGTCTPSIYAGKR